MPEELSQSLNISGGQLSDVQIGQAGANLAQSQQNTQSNLERQLNPVEIVELITQFQALLRSSSLPDLQKEKILKHLDSVKDEAKEENPDKDFAMKNLQRATKVLKGASGTVEAGQGLWDKLQPIVIKLLPWLGTTKNFFGL